MSRPTRTYSCVHLINACLYFCVIVFVAMAQKDHISVVIPTCKCRIIVAFPNSKSPDLFELQEKSQIWTSIHKSLYPHTCRMRCGTKCSMDMWRRVYYMCRFTALRSIIDGTFYVTPSVEDTGHRLNMLPYISMTFGREKASS